jgi:hypothetical protein
LQSIPPSRSPTASSDPFKHVDVIEMNSGTSGLLLKATTPTRIIRPTRISQRHHLGNNVHSQYTVQAIHSSSLKRIRRADITSSAIGHDGLQRRVSSFQHSSRNMNADFCLPFRPSMQHETSKPPRIHMLRSGSTRVLPPLKSRRLTMGLQRNTIPTLPKIRTPKRNSPKRNRRMKS